MEYTSGDTILATHYNSVRGDFNTNWGVGSGDQGYGQANTISAVSAGDTVTALATGTNIFIADFDEGIQLGNGTFASAPFSVTKAGLLKATSGTVGG